ncbi:hypothetical protein RCH22_000583 [Cryobacterium psychrotolerans]|nr:hypothetical protein [Cryobacterium psychrotolerans]
MDASLLVLPQVGFHDPTDAGMLGTVAAIEADLLRDGLVLRYRTEVPVDGLAGRVDYDDAADAITAMEDRGARLARTGNEAAATAVSGAGR